jgi:predicted amidohydrolase YtcJ
MATTLITGGTVVSTTGRSAADVLIDGETIAAVLAPGSTLLGHDLAASVDSLVDATGKYVIPGGIDAHTHMQLPFGGTSASDTFETGTRAAAWGGTTTIVDFAVQRAGERVEASGEREVGVGERRADEVRRVRRGVAARAAGNHPHHTRGRTRTRIAADCHYIQPRRRAAVPDGTRERRNPRGDRARTWL